MNKYIQKLIQEQFNIGNMDLSNNKPKRNMNIFNKKLLDPYVVYDKILNSYAVYGKINREDIKDYEIEYLNDCVSIVNVDDKYSLHKVVEFYDNFYPNNSLNWLDVSGITDMSKLFSGTYRKTNKYNGDISKWDTSNVTNMRYMFNFAELFNQSIGDWDVSKVTDMCYMFYEAHNFNQPIGDWDVSSVTDMTRMFDNAYKFNKDISKWDVSGVTNMSCMFFYAYDFNQSIGSWDVSSVTNMQGMFYHAEEFNQPIGGWNVSNVTTMREMFCYAYKFNQPIGKWNVSSVIDMSEMFYEASDFNQYIGDWNVSSVTNIISNVINMGYMFNNAKSFNQNISNWNINNNIDIWYMFLDCNIPYNYKPKKITQEQIYYKKILDGNITKDEIEKLDLLDNVIKPKDKDELRKIIVFYSRKYPEHSLNWLNVIEITDMCKLFMGTKYNGDISRWHTSNVTDMSYMFYKAYMFNQSISNWNISDKTDISKMFDHCPIREEYKPKKCR